jgi:hypothetical protein
MPELVVVSNPYLDAAVSHDDGMADVGLAWQAACFVLQLDRHCPAQCVSIEPENGSRSAQALQRRLRIVSRE